LAIVVNSAAACLLPVMFVIFDAVFAAWYNRAHIALAMPDDWARYRAEVPEWRLRRRPYIARTATLYFPDAGRDARPQAWLLRRPADGLTVEVAPSRPSLQRQRIVYVSSDPDLNAVGVAAFGRALEHLGGLPAFIGWIMRLPGANEFAELVTFLVPLRRLNTR